MTTKQEILESIKGGLVVSCQARKGWPMYGSDIMAAFAQAAYEGGAVAIRATEPENIQAIQDQVSLPIMGIYKQWYEGYEVYITPTYQSAVAIIEAGADIVAMDGTMRERPNGENLAEMIAKIKKNYPHIVIMTDCATIEEGKYCQKCGTDLVSTTLYGYTEETKDQTQANFELIQQLSDELEVPIIAEGKLETPADVVKAYASGAYSVVVGTAITRPDVITSRFVAAIHQVEKVSE